MPVSVKQIGLVVDDYGWPAPQVVAELQTSLNEAQSHEVWMPVALGDLTAGPDQKAIT